MCRLHTRRVHIRYNIRRSKNVFFTLPIFSSRHWDRCTNFSLLTGVRIYPEWVRSGMPDRSLLLVAAAALPALVVLAVNTHAALSLMVNAQMFLDVVVRLLNEGNRDRALKLSKTLEAPVVKLARFALESAPAAVR